MINLIDGKGQLGFELEKLIKKENSKENLFIHHTWNFLDKSEETQKKCYQDFREFVDNHKDSKIVFISTYSQAQNNYTLYKQLSESYLISNNEKGYVVRLPNLIGKGICQKIKDNQVENIFGEMELMNIKDAAKKVLDFSTSESTIKNISIPGIKIPAHLAKDLILFGKK